MRRILFIIFSLFVICVSLGTVNAQWSTDPTENLAVCTADTDQIYPIIVSDDSGGAIIIWSDYRWLSWDIFAQRIDKNGYPQWPENGMDICVEVNDQIYSLAISDGSSGAIITWWDYRNGVDYDIYVQRVGSNGERLWNPRNGIPICVQPNNQVPFSIVSDGSGGAIIVWYDNRGVDYDIYAQRVDNTGQVLWQINGKPICTETGDQSAPSAVSDGSGGVIIAWSDKRGSTLDLYAQRVDENGNPIWAPGGVPICTGQTGSWYRTPVLVEDGGGGAIVVWPDGRSGDADIYGQRVFPGGSAAWVTNGVPIYAGPENQYPYSFFSKPLISDGSGGAIVTWRDYRSGDYDVYAQRVSGANGWPLWGANGIPISVQANDQVVSSIVSDGSGGGIICWEDNRSGQYDVYVQRVNADGQAQWTTNGLAVCLAESDQRYPVALGDGAGGAIITWGDKRNDNGDIYAQKINGNGSLDVLPPLISFDPDSFSQFPDTLDSYEITCKVTDNVSVASCSLFYSINAGTTFACTTMVSSPGDSIWTGDIPAQQTNTAVNYYILASDSAENLATSPPNAPDSTFGFLVIDATPPTISYIPLTTTPADSAVTLTGTVTDNSSLESVWLFYRMGGKTAYDSLKMTTADDSTYQAQIPGGSVTTRGVDYYLWATDGVNSATSPSVNAQSSPYSLRVTIDKIAKDKAQPAGKTVTAYRMISVPIQLDDGSPQKVLEDDLEPYKNTKWRFGRWNPQSKSYKEYPDVDKFASGRAFWLIVKDAGKVIDAGPGTSVTTADSFSIALQPGWNQIAVPFDFPVAWSQVRKARPDEIGGNSPVGWDGSYSDNYKVSTLQPWDGYWVENTGSQVNTIYIPPQEASSGTPAKRTTSPALAGGWWLKVSVSSGGLSDRDNFLGICPDASDKWDRNDWSEPPSLPGLLNLYFSHTDWGRRSGRYMADIRKQIGQGQTWDISIEGGEELNLKVENIGSLPRAYEAYLLDLNSRRALDLRKGQEYSTDGGRQFQVLVGSPEYIRKVLDEFSSIPAHFSLSQNYPNPFNPTTAISYQLSGVSPHHTTLKIYNICGQLVSTLVDEEQAPGYYSVTWNGGRFSSGVYFYRLHAGDYTQTRRMILLK